MNPAQRVQMSDQPGVTPCGEGSRAGGARALRWPSKGGTSRLRALVLILASGACTQVLDLEGYEFEPSDGVGGAGALDNNLGGNAGASGSAGTSNSSGNAGSGSQEPLDDAGSPDGSSDPDASSGGVSGSAGAAGASGSSGAAGASGGGASGSAGGGGFSGASGASGSGGYGGSGSGECGVSEACVPTVPGGWQGPVVVGRNGVTSCPSEYSTPGGALTSGLIAPAASCACGCVLNGVSCYMESGNTGDAFIPQSSCESPPTNDDCLVARVNTSCTPQPFASVSPYTWQTTQLRCGGASLTTACSGGGCYPTSSFGPICIFSAGDVACPGSFPNKTLYFQNVSDNRSCTGCGCNPTGQECEVDIQVCDVGGFTDKTLNSLEEIPVCLNSSDGDGVTFFQTRIVTTGTCQANGGSAQGSATATNPLTVCCL